MKILFLIGNGAFAGSFGGVEKVACNIANNLAGQGYEIVIVSNDVHSCSPAWSLNENIRIVNLNGTGKKLYKIRTIPRLLRELARPIQNTPLAWSLRHAETERRKAFFASSMKAVLEQEKPDLILSFFYEDLFLLPFSDSGSSFPIPVIQMFHGVPAQTLRYSSPRLNRLLNQCSSVQILLPSFAEHLKRLGISNISVIPNWVNEYSKGVEYRGKEQGRILYLGRISKEKRPHLLIQAFNRLAKKHPNWTLDLYGSGKDRYFESVMRLIRSQEGEQIVFHGPTNQAEEIMRTADIFAFPSELEGFGLSLVDAMSIGLPSVGFRSALGVNELIQDGDNGLLADEGKVSFAQKLELLINQPDLRVQLGNKARQFAAAFNQKSVMDAWEKLFKKSISK